MYICIHTTYIVKQIIQTRIVRRIDTVEPKGRNCVGVLDQYLYARYGRARQTQAPKFLLVFEFAVCILNKAKSAYRRA